MLGFWHTCSLSERLCLVPEEDHTCTVAALICMSHMRGLIQSCSAASHLLQDNTHILLDSHPGWLQELPMNKAALDYVLETAFAQMPPTQNRSILDYHAAGLFNTSQH